MSPTKLYTGRNVYDAAVARVADIYKEGHRVIVAFSGGKDSGVLLEISIEAARLTGNLPVEVMFRDDEILYPPTVEYCERIAQRKEVNMHWLVNEQAAPNIYNRELPFYWCFDPELPREKWTRSYPDYAEIDRENINLYYIINSNKYPPPATGLKIVGVVGIRCEESSTRRLALQGLKGPRSYGIKDKRLITLYPIYDWTSGDVWRAVSEKGWDYNKAYDALTRLGLSKSRQRLSQIAMSPIGADGLQVAAKAWPRWFDTVTQRLPGIRAVAYYGERVLRPVIRDNESWEDCFYRTCVNEAPQWVSERSMWTLKKMQAYHHHHSDQEFPQVKTCPACKQSWKTLANSLYSGDPFHIEITWLPDVEPAQFRPSETRAWPKSHKSITNMAKKIFTTIGEQ